MDGAVAMTVAPPRTRRFTMASPMPLVPPVTRTRLPCQYDRVTFPHMGADGKRVVLRYEYLGRTQGLGTFHFGEQTVKDMGLLLAQSQRGQQVNSVFGEGAAAPQDSRCPRPPSPA